MKYCEADIEGFFEESRREACAALSRLPVAEGRVPVVGSLTGWVYEQVIRHCLALELEGLGLEIEEQVRIAGRARVDLLVGRAAIEVKAYGSFGAADDRKYRQYRGLVEEKRLSYFYLTRREGSASYRAQTSSIFGPERAFFLDTDGDWKRFVHQVVACQTELR